LRCTTTDGDKVIRQTNQYFRYQPGKSQLVLMTGVMGAAKANVRQRIGYFDAANGIFFEQTSSGLSVVRRTFTSGSAVDNSVAQADWNLDKMDGDGLSGHTIDVTKDQIFIIDLQWLGTGRARVGFIISGAVVYCHQFLAANVLTTVYMTTANLPARYELENTGTAGSNTDLLQVCTSVSSEGGFDDERGIIHSAGNGATGIAVTTRRPVFSIRSKATFNSITNRGSIFPETARFLALGGDVFWELVFNGTLTGASFADVGSNSLAEKDVAATAISGGEVVDTGYIASGGPASSARQAEVASLTSKLALGLDIAGTAPDVFSIVATAVSSSPTVHGALRWKELY
jgi:hypothetical protein